MRLAAYGVERNLIFWGHPKPRQVASPPAPPYAYGYGASPHIPRLYAYLFLQERVVVGVTVDRVSYLRENARLTIECFLCTVSEVVEERQLISGNEKVRLIVILSMNEESWLGERDPSLALRMTRSDRML